MNTNPIIQLENVTVSLGNENVLENINLTINKGEFIAVLGPNGSGKSTLLKVILGLIKPRSGVVKVFGNPVIKAGNHEVGYSPQAKLFDPDIPITGKDYVKLGLIDNDFFNFWGVNESDKKIERVLKQVDVEELANKKLGKMSGGEQQRISLAQALVSDPHLLLLDEPLANLDISYQSEILQRISTFHKEHNHTILLVAHDVNPLLPFINKVIYLAHTHAEIGSPDKVIEDSVLTKLYGSPVKVFDVDGRIFVAAIEDIVH